MTTCKLCNREIAGEVDGNVYCCHGCEAIDQIISTLELEDSERQAKIDALLKVIFPVGNSNDEKPEIHRDYLKEEHFRLNGMSCPACSWLIHHALEQTGGVSDASVNFIAETCSIRFDPMQIGVDEIKEQIHSLGYEAVQDESGSFYNYYAFGAGWFFALNVMMLSFVVYPAETDKIPHAMKLACSFLLLGFTVLTVFVSAWDTYKKGIAQIKRLDFRMETLIVVSTTTAFCYSLYSLSQGDFPRIYFDVVCLLLMLVETGNLITASFYNRLRRRVEELRNCLPKKVRLKKGSDEHYTNTTELQPGQPFEVKREEIVPTDGVLLADAEFDFSLINGESRGVNLKEGQFVGAGARLLSHSSMMLVPPSGPSSLISNIIGSTVSAFNTQRESYSTGDRISRIFVPIVIAVSLVGAGFYFYHDQHAEAIVCFMSVLIVACPCAFGIAEPLVLTTAVDRIKHFGIQVFNGNALRQVPDTVIFDKTGTLTSARMTVKDIHWVGEKDQHLLNILASLERGIEHPIAKALNTLGSGLPVEDRRVAAQSVEGSVDGTRYQCGRLSLYPELQAPEGMDKDIVSLVAFGTDRDCLAIISVSDELKAESREVITSLQSMNKDLHICSGDRAPIVAHVAKELGIAAFESHMTPEGKQDFIRGLQDKGKSVMMVGDGINDAQSLAASDFGVAVFSGQIPAQMSSDAVFLTRDFRALIKLFRQLKVIRRKILYNYSWAFAYNLVGVSLALSGKLSPTFCAIGMIFSNLVVVYNSLTGKVK